MPDLWAGGDGTLEHLLLVLRGESMGAELQIGGSLILWTAHALSFISWLSLVVVVVHLALTVYSH